MIDFITFEKNYNDIQNRIANACKKANRDIESVKLLPVTKNHPKDVVVYCNRKNAWGVGENRVQEAIEKKTQLTNISIRWELIGHLQSNKAKLAVQYFDRIQSLDSITLAEKLNKICEEQNRQTLPVLIEANSGADPAKFGQDFSGLQKLVDTTLKLPHLKLEGLMCIAPLNEDLNVAKNCFEKLHEWKIKIEESFKITLPELSMGMSHDFEIAISCGSTIIRVGSALFGPR